MGMGKAPAVEDDKKNEFCVWTEVQQHILF